MKNLLALSLLLLTLVSCKKEDEVEPFKQGEYTIRYDATVRVDYRAYIFYKGTNFDIKDSTVQAMPFSGAGFGGFHTVFYKKKNTPIGMNLKTEEDGMVTARLIYDNKDTLMTEVKPLIKGKYTKFEFIVK